MNLYLHDVWSQAHSIKRSGQMVKCKRALRSPTYETRRNYEDEQSTLWGTLRWSLRRWSGLRLTGECESIHHQVKYEEKSYISRIYTTSYPRRRCCRLRSISL